MTFSGTDRSIPKTTILNYCMVLIPCLFEAPPSYSNSIRKECAQSLFLNGMPIEFVDCIKYLEVCITSGLNQVCIKFCQLNVSQNNGQ